MTRGETFGSTFYCNRAVSVYIKLSMQSASNKLSERQSLQH